MSKALETWTTELSGVPTRICLGEYILQYYLQWTSSTFQKRTVWMFGWMARNYKQLFVKRYFKLYDYLCCCRVNLWMTVQRHILKLDATCATSKQRVVANVKLVLYTSCTLTALKWHDRMSVVNVNYVCTSLLQYLS
jgi:hypothetical protein